MANNGITFRAELYSQLVTNAPAVNAIVNPFVGRAMPRLPYPRYVENMAARDRHYARLRRRKAGHGASTTLATVAQIYRTLYTADRVAASNFRPGMNVILDGGTGIRTNTVTVTDVNPDTGTITFE